MHYINQSDDAGIMSDTPLNYSSEPSVLIFGDQSHERDRIAQDVVTAGGRVAAAREIVKASKQLGRQVSVDAIYLCVDDVNATAISLLERVDMYSAQQGTPVILRTTTAALDVIFPILTSDKIEYLLDHSRADSIAALAMALRPRETLLNDNSVDNDLGSLQKLTADVQRIAKTLAKLTDSEDADDSRQLREAPVGFKPAPDYIGYAARSMAREEKIDAAQRQGVTARQIRNMIRTRRQREEFFPSSLFADPAWDMLLDLMAAKLEGQAVSVSSLCIAACVPPTTALRWIKSMTDSGIFQRKADDHDGRRIFIELSDASAEAMIGFFAGASGSDMLVI